MTKEITHRAQMSKYILIFCISTLLHFQLKGSHIIGGDVFFDCITVDTVTQQVSLNVEFQLFRDARPNPDPNAARSFDDNAFFGVYRRTPAGWVFVTQAGPLDIILEEPVPINDLDCLIAPPSLSMLRGVYRFDLTLDMIDEDYMIAYQRCCRGVAITNLVNASQEGSVFAIEITPEGLAACTRGVKYSQFPPSVLCLGFPFRYDHSVDTEPGDSVAYRICNPLSSGRFLQNGPNNLRCNGCGPNVDIRCGCDVVAPCPGLCLPEDFREVSFRRPLFSSSAPVAGDPELGIHPETGLITGTPNVLGELVMAVCADVYRDGVELLRIRRDMQFVVVDCERDLEARVGSSNETLDGTLELIVCGDLSSVDFVSTSINERFIDQYLWTFDTGSNENGENIVSSSQQNPTVEFPELGIYDAKLVLNPGAFVCTDSADIRVVIFPDLEADYDFIFDTCVASPIDFMDLSVTGGEEVVSWDWDYGDGNGSRQQNPRHLFSTPGEKRVTLSVEDNNGCIDSLSQQFLYTPLPEELAVLPNFHITCVPGVVTFDNISEPIDETYEVLWDFGDGTSGPESMELSPTHVYTEPGDYTIRLSVTSPTGCTATQTFNNFVEILDGFSIDFTTSPEQPTIQQNVVTFTGMSDVPGDFFWQFGDGGASLDQVPVHTYRDTGLYDVTLIVTDEVGCIDSLTKPIYIAPLVDITYPNAFTPDGDDKNDFFRGKGAGEITLISNYELLIFDRWGKVVFSTSDPEDGWNGRLNNAGQILPIGVYSYLASYDVPVFGRQEKRGVATLIR